MLLKNPIQFLVIFFIVFAVIPNGAFAQTDFEPGFVITTSSDTLYGSLDRKTDQNLSRLCTFRAEDGSVQEFYPGEIKGFKFQNGKYFASRQLNDTSYFLEYLVKGEISVFKLEKLNHTRYFIEKKGLGFREIPYNEEIKQADGHAQLFRSKKHIGILGFFMRDAPQLHGEIAEIEKPTAANLKNLVITYHELANKYNEINYVRKSPRLKLLVEPVAGIVYFGKESQLPEVYSIQMGFYVNVSMQEVNPKLYLRTGFSYTNSEKGDKIEHFPKVPLQLGYIYPDVSFKPKAAAGFNLYPVNPFFQTTAFMIGFEAEISTKIRVSMNYDIDFQTAEQLILVPDTFHSHALTAGISFWL